MSRGEHVPAHVIAILSGVLFAGCGSQTAAPARETLAVNVQKTNGDPVSDDDALPIRPALRRLTRTEFRNSVRDLLELSFEPGDDPTRSLPPDPQPDGFDKRAGALQWEETLLDAYLQVAGEIAERAIVSGDPPVPTEKRRFEYEDIPVHPYEVTTRPWVETVPGGLMLMSGMAPSKRGLRREDSGRMIPVAGRYAVRIRAAADTRSGGERILLRIWRPEVGETLLETFVEAPLDDPQTYEIVLPLQPEGADELLAIFVNGTRFGQANLLQMEMNAEVEKLLAAGRQRDAARLRSQMRAEGMIAMSRPDPATISTDDLPRLFLDWIEIEGPLYESWPPRSHQIVFSSDQGDASDTEYVRRIFARLLPRAYRRPVEPHEVEQIVNVATSELNAGEPLTEAVKAALTVVLCSPQFLMVAVPRETVRDGLDDYELAERLSYFLWSSLPDEELFQAAGSGEVRTRGGLIAQATRMLDDEKSDALVTDFARQWLKVDEFDRFAPDIELYPAFARPENARLQDDFRQEALAFFRETLRTDRPVGSFLDSDWTMLNERLASYYGIAGVSGEDFRRVALPPDSHRGGLLGLAGLHRWGSDGNRTKPVHRGVYIRDVVFNDRPPLPPPGVGEVEPNQSGQNLSVRDRLVMHRDVEGCAECHLGIDCYGLALENFNAVGRWREVQDGEVRNWTARGGAPRIDASGRFPDGREYQNYDEFKQLLTDDEDRFLRALAEKLLAYALARRLQPEDAGSVDAAVDYADRHGRTLRSLILGIAAGEAFRSR